MAPQVASSDSEDDKPLAALTNGHSKTENGNTNGKRPLASSDDDSDDDKPLAKRAKQTNVVLSSPEKPPANGRGQKRKAPAFSSESSDDDVPLAALTKSEAIPMPGAMKPSDSDDEDDKPLAETVNGRAPRRGRLSQNYKEESDSDSDVPLAKAKAKAKISPGTKSKPSSSSNSKAKKPPKKKVKKEESDAEKPSSDDDVPLALKTVPTKTKGKTLAKKEKEEIKKEDLELLAASSDDDIPLAQKAATAKKAKAAPKATKAKPAANGASAKKGKKEQSVSPKKGKQQVKKNGAEEEGDDAEQEEEYKWWLQEAMGDGTRKWETLEHNGVLFPPPYIPLPSHVKLRYDGKPLTLPPESEEVAGFFGAMIETTHAQDATFRKNFFEDFQGVLEKYPPKEKVKIKDLDKCDFRPMYEYFEGERAKKKAMNKAEKKEVKDVRDKLEAPYTHCLLDGRKEKVGNFRMEPPGLFRGRGEHPKKGKLKQRVRPEDIVINIGETAKVPVPNVPGKWGEVVHDNTVTWLANWKENVNGNFKYVFLAAGSSLKGQSDYNKFEKARELKNHVDRIRKDYTADLTSKTMADRQRATAMYFIDVYALRAGNEKGEEEADTVGCCSLRYEHITLEKPDKLILDFLGKDSIRYYNELHVQPQIFKNIRIFKEGKSEGDDLFDRVTTSGLNKHLASYMKGLTAKVFRTYNASITMERQLLKADLTDKSLPEKILAFNQANRDVAILCNHQRTVAANFGASMEKMNEKLRAMKYQRRKLRQALLTQEPKLKKKRKDLTEDESDIDDDWIADHEDELRKRDIEKAEKKFAKEKEKALAEGKSPLKAGVLKDRIEAINEEYDRLKGERGTGKAELKTTKASEKIEDAIGKLDDRIKAFRLQRQDKDEGKEVSLTTSKTNYIDPRIIAAWCKRSDVPIEKVMPKTLMVKFPWALDVPEDFVF